MDGSAVRLELAGLLDRPLEIAYASHDLLDDLLVALQGLAVGPVTHLYTSNPRPMPDCPGLTVAPDEAPAQQELREAVPGAKEILFGGLSAAAQVTNRLLVRSESPRVFRRPI